MENTKENKSDIKLLSDGYKEGAIAGGLVGVVFAAVLRRKLWVGGLIGMVAGAYIANEIFKSKKEGEELKEVLTSK